MKLEVAVIKGDGVGPEMMDQATAILEEICRIYGHGLELISVPACSLTIEFGYSPLPEESLKRCQSVPAVLFGNTGLRKYRNLPLEKRPEAALMLLRKGMKVTTNIRPVRCYPELSCFSPLKDRILERGVDLVFVRDIVGGILCSEKMKRTGVYGQEAYEYEYYNEKIVTDTARIAFRLAEERRKIVASLDKSNVLESSRLWRNTVQKVSQDYPGICLQHDYIDHAAMCIMEAPHQYDVLVTSNVFGDIIADEGTQMTGTPYLYASAEVNREGQGIYTPNQLHHPDETLIGKNRVNPVGMIAAAALMLRYTFGLEEEAVCVEESIRRVISKGYGTEDIWLDGRQLVPTDEMGKAIRKEICRWK